MELNPYIKALDVVLCIVGIVWALYTISCTVQKPYDSKKVRRNTTIAMILAFLVLIATLLAAMFV